MGGNELDRALKKLDGDRAAAPLLVARDRLIASRDEAEKAIRDAHQALESLIRESETLPEQIRELEHEILALAGSRSRSSMPVSHQTDERQHLRELRDRLASQIRNARRAVRAAREARLGPPAPKKALQPGYAAAVILGGSLGSLEVPEAAGVLPSWRPGVTNARGTAQAMMARAERIRQGQDAQAEERPPQAGTGDRPSIRRPSHELEGTT